MGSSKKKHRKNKNKDKDREKKRKDKDILSPHELGFRSSFGSGCGVGSTHFIGLKPNSSMAGDSSSMLNRGDTFGHNSSIGTVAKQPLRLVLKVPPSCYSPSTIMTSSAANSSSSVVSSTSTVGVQNVPSGNVPIPTSSNAFAPSSSSQTTFANHSSMNNLITGSNSTLSSCPPVNSSSGGDAASFSNFTSASMEHNVSSVGTLERSNEDAAGGEFLSDSSKHGKKQKKSKKSKKSKHKKHSHHHSHHHKHHHRKHHHGSSCSHHNADQTQTVPVSSTTQWLPNTPFDPHNQFSTESEPNTTTDNAAGAFAPTAQTSPFLQPSSTNTADLTSSCFSGSSLWQSRSIDSSLPTQSTNKTSLNAGGFSASANTSNSSVGSPNTSSELKLKLSKSSTSCQYSTKPKSTGNGAVGVTPVPVNAPIFTPISGTGVKSLTAQMKYSTPVKLESSSISAVSTSATNSVGDSAPPITTTAAQLSSLSSSLITTTASSSKQSSKSSSHHKTKKKEKPHIHQLLNYLLKQLQRKDTQQFFAMPVSDSFAPGYSAIIANPMDLSTIRKKITSSQYRTLGDFMADVKLMCDNAMKYNHPETIYYKAASKLWHYTKSKLFKKDALLDYSKSYPKLTPMELSLMPSHQVFAKSGINGFSTLSAGASFGHSGLSCMESGAMLGSGMNSMTAGRGVVGAVGSSFVGLHSSDGGNSRFITGLVGSGANGSICGGSVAMGAGGRGLNAGASTYFANIDIKMNNLDSTGSLLSMAKKDACCDGMTAEELIESVKQSAKRASEKLNRARGIKSELTSPNEAALPVSSSSNNTASNPVHLSYLTETPTGEILLNSIRNHPLETPPVKRVCLDSIYSPTETGRIELNLLSNPMDSIKTSSTDLARQDPSAHKSKSTTESSACENNVGANEQSPEEKEEKVKQELIQSLVPYYGNDEFGLDYALSIARFARSNEYTVNLVSSLLGVLTAGQHRAVLNKFYKLMNENSDYDQSTT